MHGTHAETISWLERQLSELEQWRIEMLKTDSCAPSRLEQINLHREWLQTQIQKLIAMNSGQTA